MKLTLIALAASTVAVFGSTLQVWSGGEFGATINDNSGTPVGSSAWAAIGVYNGAALSGSSTAADLVSAFSIGTGFTPTAVVSTEIIPAGFGAGNAGAFNINDISKASTASVHGQNIALVIWTGGADLSSATEALVFEYTTQYENAAAPMVLAHGTAAGTLAFGQSSTQMSALAIPEPSSALLLGLGGLCLLVRRKR